jgi:hypothetical protein
MSHFKKTFYSSLSDSNLTGFFNSNSAKNSPSLNTSTHSLTNKRKSATFEEKTTFYGVNQPNSKKNKENQFHTSHETIDLTGDDDDDTEIMIIAIFTPEEAARKAELKSEAESEAESDAESDAESETESEAESGAESEVESEANSEDELAADENIDRDQNNHSAFENSIQLMSRQQQHNEKFLEMLWMMCGQN